MGFYLAGIAPLVIFLGGLFLWLKWRHLWNGESPLKEKLLRGPGESLRVKVEDLAYSLVAPIFIAMSAGAGLAYLTWHWSNYSGEFKTQIYTVGWCGAVGVMVVSSWRLIHLTRKFLDYRLGFSGERAVGEELNKLMTEGCHVYHDLPTEKIGNIDHVVIAPSGVYAIETKAPRKKKSFRKKRSGDYYKVIFNGEALQFSDRHFDTRCIAQAERNANWLADVLSKAEAEAIHVEPVLVLVGWFVERKGKGAVSVLNHREIKACIIRSNEPVLTEQQIKRIAHEIDARCRTENF
jgi:hypothetical protein